MIDHRALCIGQHALFDATDPWSHARAAELCAECPLIAECRDRLAEARAAAKAGGSPEGTWAGQLIGGRLRPDCGTEQGYQWHRHRRESCAECRAAHSRHVIERRKAQKVKRPHRSREDLKRLGWDVAS